MGSEIFLRGEDSSYSFFFSLRCRSLRQRERSWDLYFLVRVVREFSEKVDLYYFFLCRSWMDTEILGFFYRIRVKVGYGQKVIRGYLLQLVSLQRSKEGNFLFLIQLKEGRVCDEVYKGFYVYLFCF